MIGQLGETNILAVGLCGNFSLIFSVVISAVSTVAGILIALFIGAEETKEAWCSFDVKSYLRNYDISIVPACSRSFSVANSSTVYERYKYYKYWCGLF